MRCSGCKNPYNEAWFSDKDCQKTYWPVHKRNCGSPQNPNGLALFMGHGKEEVGLVAFEAVNV